MVLSEKTGRLVEAFFLCRKEFLKIAQSEPSHVLACALSEVLMFYANDKNSSALREWFVLRIAGCSPREGKIGYNGFKDGVPYEVKPRNIRKDKQRKKLNGDGNFTDLTYKRIKKYLRDSVRVLVAGFVDGVPVYILEVPFECLYGVLKRQLDEKFGGSRPRGMFLRSANFSFRDYESCGHQVKCLFLNPNWREFSNWLNREFQRYLERFERSEM